MSLGAETAGETRSGTGFFGKLPSHGDFVSRRLPPQFLAEWHTWIDHSVERSRGMLGDAWLTMYLASPIWCFAASSGCCGDSGFAGVLMPSLDRVGRYYPLSIVAMFDPEYSAARVAAEATEWFERMETLALSCLADGFDFGGFDAALQSEPLPPLCGDTAASPSVADRTTALAVQLGRLLMDKSVRHSLWWTSGSPAIAAGWRAFEGLPKPEEFAGLIGRHSAALRRSPGPAVLSHQGLRRRR